MKENILKVSYVPTIESRELALYAINTSALYNGITGAVMDALAKRVNNGSYEAEKAVKAFYEPARRAAEMYCKEFGGDWKAVFPLKCRKLSAAEMLEHYAEEIAERAEKSVKKKWTVAEIRLECSAAGNHFFDRETVKFWGTKIESGVYSNNCFVTSEDNFDRSARLYSVRRWIPETKEIETVSFQETANKHAAMDLAKNWNK